MLCYIWAAVIQAAQLILNVTGRQSYHNEHIKPAMLDSFLSYETHIRPVARFLSG